MSKIGEIRKISGFITADRASVYVEDGQCLLDIDGHPIRYELGKSLARVEVGTKAYTSGTKVLAKSSLAALAGHTWKQGSGAWSGFYGGLASSLDVRSEKLTITVYSLEGHFFTGETTSNVVEFLYSGSPELSDEEILEHIGNAKRLERYVADAERTIPEVEKNIKDLKVEIEQFERLSKTAETFDERDSAHEKHTELLTHLDQQERIHGVLIDRIKINEKYGDYKSFDQRKDKVMNQISSISQRTGLKWKTFVIGFVSMIISFDNDYSDTTNMVLKTMGYIFLIYPIIDVLFYPTRKLKLNRLRKELTELQIYKVL